MNETDEEFVKRMKVEAEQRLSSTTTTNDSDWANMEMCDMIGLSKTILHLIDIIERKQK